MVNISVNLSVNLSVNFSVNLSVNLSGEPYLLTLFANLQFFLHKVAFEIHFEEKVQVRVRSATIIKWGCAHVWRCEVRACDAKDGHNPCLVKFWECFDLKENEIELRFRFLDKIVPKTSEIELDWNAFNEK